MDKGYENEKFAGLRIKISVAKKFRRFSKKLGASQSMALLRMIDFFEINELSPDDRLGNTVSSLKHQIKSRFNAVIAIIRDIEKNQTKPTAAMLQNLFEEVSKEEEEDEIFFDTPTLLTENEILTYYRNQYEAIQIRFSDLRRETLQLMERTVWSKSSFGNGHWKLEMTREEFEQLKKRITDLLDQNR